MLGVKQRISRWGFSAGTAAINASIYCGLLCASVFFFLC
jgi:hypothetical protein